MPISKSYPKLLQKTESLSDRQFALLVAIALLMGILVAFLPVSLFGIKQVIQRGEEFDTKKELERTVGIIENELSGLALSAWDYGNWDETYQFAQDGNQEYIETNLSSASLSNLGINWMVVIDNSGNVIYSQGVDPANQVLVEPVTNATDLLEKYPNLIAGDENSSPQQGIALLRDQAMLVASQPILTSQSTGPSTGTLIYAVYLNEAEREALSEIAKRGLHFWSPTSTNLPGVRNIEKLRKEGVASYPLDKETIAAYQVINDLNGQPALILQLDNPRTLYQQGSMVVAIYSIGFILLSVALSAGVYRLVYSFVATQRRSKQVLERLGAIVSQSSDAIMLVNEKGVIVDSNQASRSTLKLNYDKTGSVCLGDILINEHKPVESLLEEIGKDGGSLQEYHCRLQDGTPIDFELNASPIHNLKFKAYSLILRDITERKAAQHALQASEERYQLAAQGANDGLWDWDLLSNQVYYSSRWKSMLGISGEISASPSEWFDRVHPEDRLQLQVKLEEHQNKKTSHFEYEHRLRHTDGNYRWMLARGVAVWNASGYAQRMAGSLTDVTRQKKIEEQLRHDALHDALTGLGNRTLLLDRLKHVNERKRRKPEMLFAMLFIDLDRFKQVNDSFGHHIGDQILVEVSRRLEKNLRAMDSIVRTTGPETIARIAGDEFVILLEDIRSQQDVDGITERILKTISEPLYIGKKQFTIGASIGVVVPEKAYKQPQDIIRDADIAMYRAKQLGGSDYVRFSHELYESTAARMMLEYDLHRAIERREFEVHYQPIYAVSDDSLIGFEALVRWNHPRLGLLYPDAFIGLAEETGMIVPIGYHVLRTSCANMKKWQQEGIAERMIMSVNLSARQLADPDLVEKITDTLEEYDLHPSLLWLEITESTLIRNLTSVQQVLMDLRRIGIKIEIDDFGMGYSSLSYLQNLPVDGFKIDRTFIKEITDNGQQIVNTLVELGRNLKLVQIAEGVETNMQKEYLQKLACEYMQGYLMARPMSIEVIEPFLRMMNTTGCTADDLVTLAR